MLYSSISISTLLFLSATCHSGDGLLFVEAGYIHRSPPSKARSPRLDYIVETQEADVEADMFQMAEERRSQTAVASHPIIRRIQDAAATAIQSLVDETATTISNNHNNNQYRIKELPLQISTEAAATTTTTIEENDGSNDRNRMSNAELIASLAITAAEMIATGTAITTSSTTTTRGIPATATLSPSEAWCLHHLDRWYSKSQSLKCPFLRRRSGDMLDNVELLMKHTVIRKKCWPLMGCPQAERPAGHNRKQNSIKYKHLSLEQIQHYIIEDWKPNTNKGYYITGKLTTGIYRDDCLFTGPDPDMPIKGLRKYVGVAAHLFDYNKSCSTLKSIWIVNESGSNQKTIEAHWQLNGILKLPWRPQLPTLEGKTIYRFDEEGLIREHEEFWDISVLYAFCQTLLPNLAAKIWKTTPPPVVVAHPNPHPAQN